METRKNYLYALMLAAAASVILLSLAGIAAITGVLPMHDSSTGDSNSRSEQEVCYRCGLIESVWSMEESLPHPSDESTVRYAVRVFMEDGNYRTLYFSDQPLFQTGEKVRVSDGTIVMRGRTAEVNQ